MKTLKSIAAAIAVAAVFSGCATMPATYSVDNSRTYEREFDPLWEGIVQFFASRNIPIKNIAKDSGVIYAEAMTFSDELADCGTPGLMAIESRTATFNVFVNRAEGRPRVSVNTQFQEVRRFDTSVTTVTCNSRGVIEKAILDSI